MCMQAKRNHRESKVHSVGKDFVNHIAAVLQFINKYQKCQLNIGQNHVYLKKKCSGQLAHEWRSTSTAIRKCKSKPQCHTSSRQARQLSVRYMESTKHRMDAGNWDPCTRLLGMMETLWNHHYSTKSPKQNYHRTQQSYCLKQNWKRLSEIGCYWSKRPHSQWFTCGSNLTFRQR